MSKSFPHLADTAFPNLDNVDPYERKTTFDYGRYDYTASAKLCNVTWTPDYAHVVGWKSAQQRDAYFAGIAGPVVELQQGFVRTQLDTIAVPVPYDVALTYSYVYLRVPMLTEDAPIDYEMPDGMRTVCAFISEVVYSAPSTTTLVLDVDYWTTYMPHLSVSSLMLERGHAPMYATDVDTYFEDPLAHCADLLTPDVDYGGSDITRGSTYQPLSTGKPLYIFASTIPNGSISGIATATNATQTGPTYSNTGARNGEQVQVNNFVWAPNGKSYAGMTSPNNVTHSDGSLPTGLYYYAMFGNRVAAGDLATLVEKLPVFAMSVQATYIVPSDLVEVGAAQNVAGVMLYDVETRAGLQRAGSIDLDKTLFDLPRDYADITKLYTFPYAHLELSDDRGNVVPIHIEDTHGSIDIEQLVCIAWPALTWEVMLTNVASTAAPVRYNWMRLNGTNVAHVIPGADFSSLTIDMGIPTYALYLSAVVEDMVGKQRDAEQARKDAIIGYQSTMRSANTAEQNAYDSNATARSNAYRSADTGKTNADASADTAKTNADASADTAKANTTTSTTNMRTNAARSNSYRSTAEYNARVYSTDTASIDLALMYATTMASVQQQQQAAISQVSNIVAGGAIGVAGSLATGNVPGAVMSGASSLSGAINAGSAYAVSISTELTIQSAMQVALADKAEAAAALSYQNVTNANAENTEITGNNATAADTMATASQTTSKANATRTQTVSKANATRSQTTSKANALASEGTGNSNANYSRDTTEENAKAQLESAQTRFASQVNHSAVLPPVAHGSYGGDYAHEQLQSRGLHLRAKTQSDAAIARAGDAFRRYGYAYNGMWHVSDWVPEGKRYCYWQSGDIIQNVKASPNVNANRNLHIVLREGVTVWADPNDVGRW